MHSLYHQLTHANMRSADLYHYVRYQEHHCHSSRNYRRHHCRPIPFFTTCETRTPKDQLKTQASPMTSSAGLFPNQEPSKQVLLDWLEQNAVHVSDAIEIYESENGWGVRATQDIGFDELRMSPSLHPSWG